MTRYVIDASVAVEYLLKTPIGLATADLIERAALLDAEALSALRAAVLGGSLEEGRALQARLPGGRS